MSNQPEALRLADYMDAALNDPNDVADAVSAELRRLHAENERLTIERDALLAVLEDIGKYTGEGSMYTTPWQDIVRSIGEKARAAIAAVEGEKE